MPKHKLILLISFTLAIILGIWFLDKNAESISHLKDFIKNLGILAPIIFILFYTIGPIFFFPVTPLSITSGLLFGPLWGSIFSLTGGAIGSCISFLISRYLLKEWIDKKTPARIALVQEKLNKQGWKFIVLARITPILPFNVQNYIFGVTNISFRTFAWASTLGFIPGAFLYTCLGYAGRITINKYIGIALF